MDICEHCEISKQQLFGNKKKRRFSRKPVVFGLSVTPNKFLRLVKTVPMLMTPLSSSQRSKIQNFGKGLKNHKNNVKNKNESSRKKLSSSKNKLLVVNSPLDSLQQSKISKSDGKLNDSKDTVKDERKSGSKRLSNSKDYPKYGSVSSVENKTELNASKRRCRGRPSKKQYLKERDFSVLPSPKKISVEECEPAKDCLPEYATCLLSTSQKNVIEVSDKNL